MVILRGRGTSTRLTKLQQKNTLAACQWEAVWIKVRSWSDQQSDSSTGLYRAYRCRRSEDGGRRERERDRGGVASTGSSSRVALMRNDVVSMRERTDRYHAFKGQLTASENYLLLPSSLVVRCMRSGRLTHSSSFHEGSSFQDRDRSSRRGRSDAEMDGRMMNIGEWSGFKQRLTRLEYKPSITRSLKIHRICHFSVFRPHALDTPVDPSNPVLTNAPLSRFSPLTFTSERRLRNVRHRGS
ncbi:hypothetical protein BC629DRAFT_1446805 [Irpex lacteus]|nr:hypothetical protein BC629DRAFT_1446805 [Irpex lacteus]